MSRISLGVAGALGPEPIARIARAVEEAGFHALWVNDTPSGDALAALAAAAAETRSLVLATGVLPLDRRPVDEIVAATRGLPGDRVVLGVGAGAARTGALALVRDGAARLRDETSARVMIGALGPRMRRLAASASFGPLLSWLTPDLAAAQAAEAHTENPDVHVALYVRTALESAATARLEGEADRYTAVPSYAANFTRLGIDVRDTVVGPETADRLGRYRAAVDEVVLRAVTPADDIDDYLRFVAQAAERFLT